MVVLLLAAQSHGQSKVIGQWDVLAGGFVLTNETAQWTAPQGTVLEFSQNEWSVENGVVKNMSGEDISGLKPEFETSSNLSVRAGVLLVKPYGPHRVRTSFFTGHFVTRIANFRYNGLGGAWDSVGPAEGVRVFVNGEESAPMQIGVWQIVSFVAPEEMPFEKTMVFSDPFTAWKRAFVGETKSVTLLNGDVSLAALRGMESALALRHGVAGIRSATPYERQEAQATGFSAFGVWKTLFLVR